MSKIITGTKKTTVEHKDEKGITLQSTVTTVEYDMEVIDTGISPCRCEDECDDCTNCEDPCGPKDLPEFVQPQAPSNVLSMADFAKRNGPSPISIEDVLQGLINGTTPKPAISESELPELIKHLENLGFKLFTR